MKITTTDNAPIHIVRLAFATVGSKYFFSIIRNIQIHATAERLVSDQRSNIIREALNMIYQTILEGIYAIRLSEVAVGQFSKEVIKFLHVFKISATYIRERKLDHM